MTEDEKYMARCLQLARQGELTTAPNPMVGAVVVHRGRIIGEGWHRAYGGPHAEVNAINSVRPEDQHLLSQATIYVSLEPCSHWGKTPPCAELLVEKKLRRVVVGCLDPNEKVAGRGIRRLREAGAEVVVGVMEKECWSLNRKFMTFHTLHRPYITLKWAQSADGFIDSRRQSSSDGEPVHFSTPWTQTLVHRLRATHQAILVGRRTYELDRPALTNRLWPGASPKPFVLHHGRLVAMEEMATEDKAPPTSLLPLSAALFESFGYQSLLVEGGAQTLRSFLEADLWDELYIEQSDIVLKAGIRAPEIKIDPKGRPIHVNFA
ncbi:MAG: bifunctional diaminohydroxyphosphoribosylaminopyrimidine deaminase/5-amino-6-(5-phosphoribosylamino)uracil reductase RibD [Bacteroidaceae bacterium]|nr:bifunctional diaminohydroxyphosphoribosylaminopyrimidine deaminase/5-amino-6-(5-phosphoribosylamino)uracil reductase RibD [Bacteroidaceae bacterium]